MPRFTSDRERRLWLWTLAALVAIYSSLGLAREIAALLREHNLLRVSFAAGVTVLVVGLAIPWLRKRPGVAEAGVVVGVLLTYATMFARMASPEERTHLLEYGVVAALIHMALQERARNGGSVRAPAALAVAMAAGFGVLDEGIQGVLPGRVFDVRDIFFNVLAAFMAVAARLAIAPQRGPGWRLWFLWLIGNAWAWGFGMFLPFGGSEGIETLQASPEDPLSAYLGFGLAAAVASAIGWWLLRKHLDSAVWWIPAGLGAAAAAGVVLLGLGAVDADLGWVVGTGLFGGIAGLSQGWVLRREIRGAGWWIGASVIGWVLGIPAGEAVGWNGLGAVYGLVTGTTLVWLLSARRR